MNSKQELSTVDSRVLTHIVERIKGVTTILFSTSFERLPYPTLDSQGQTEQAGSLSHVPSRTVFFSSGGGGERRFPYSYPYSHKSYISQTQTQKKKKGLSLFPTSHLPPPIPIFHLRGLIHRKITQKDINSLLMILPRGTYTWSFCLVCGFEGAWGK